MPNYHCDLYPTMHTDHFIIQEYQLDSVRFRNEECEEVDYGRGVQI
jgi:hypothetical protein